ncbi:hypothetical protein GCM10010503_07680 [Streptomyces lucensis JCM 4490]|uniref:Uncharacterized protein n=1 Tax=Streptomyces lucensis JCM 4490 TaxID=1306176 RepID=A0A918MLP1_9ACTN|nr:hypothetical protein GCM10010503_07680 [Streptomyces lucensis JCM 4490]
MRPSGCRCPCYAVDSTCQIIEAARQAIGDTATATAAALSPVNRRTFPVRLRATTPPPTRIAAPAPMRIAAPASAASAPLSSPATPDAAVPGPVLDQVLDESHEFVGFEGLGEKGVHADIESGLDLMLRARADDGEREMVRAGIGTEPGGGPQTVQPRHDDIECHDIGPHLVNDVQTLGTIGRGHDLEPFQLKVDPDQLPDDLVVVHNKHPAGGAWHNSRVGPHRSPRPGFPHFHPVQGTHHRPPGKRVPDHPVRPDSVLPVAASEQLSSRHAPVAQGIEQRPPEPCAQVRILPGALAGQRPKTTF